MRRIWPSLLATAVSGSVALAGGPGASLVGKPSPEWPVLRWVQGGPLSLSDLRGKVVLVRFFMDADCPYCSATAPALNALYREFGSRGLVVVGMYTPKPRPTPTTVEEVSRYVAAYGFLFPVAIDDEWSALRRLWLDRVPDAEFTSASLLIDREGIVRHVHPGGSFAANSKDAKARAEYAAMRAAVVSALGGRGED
ncbi:MAG: TlpA family protein disulfide reductase [Acidobacteriia bacterium]|nr:TlpA family protein disulfide reductase [Terriglobia bacterium]